MTTPQFPYVETRDGSTKVTSEALPYLRVVIREDLEDAKRQEQGRAGQLQLIMTARLGTEGELSDAELDDFLEETKKLTASWESEG